MIKVVNIKPIPANSNPFNHEHYLMGTYVADNVLIMHATFSAETGLTFTSFQRNEEFKNDASYIEVVNVPTGERIRIVFDKGNFGKINESHPEGVLTQVCKVCNFATNTLRKEFCSDECEAQYHDNNIVEYSVEEGK